SDGLGGFGLPVVGVVECLADFVDGHVAHHRRGFGDLPNEVLPLLIADARAVGLDPFRVGNVVAPVRAVVGIRRRGGDLLIRDRTAVLFARGRDAIVVRTRGPALVIRSRGAVVIVHIRHSNSLTEAIPRPRRGGSPRSHRLGPRTRAPRRWSTHRSPGLPHVAI